MAQHADRIGGIVLVGLFERFDVRIQHFLEGWNVAALDGLQGDIGTARQPAL